MCLPDTGSTFRRDAMLEEIVVGALRAGLTCPGQKRPLQNFRVLGGALHVDVAMDISAKVGSSFPAAQGF